MKTVRAYVLSEFTLTPLQKVKSSLAHKTGARKTSWDPETPKVGDGAAYGSKKLSGQGVSDKEVSSDQVRPTTRPN